MTRILTRMLMLIALVSGSSCIAFAQQSESPTETAAPVQNEQMVVATREARPFAFQDDDGNWTGIGIDLWKHIAEAQNIDYRFAEASLADMIDGVADGRFGASVAALTITPEREAKVDFTHPFYTTGFGIAVHKSRQGWIGLIVSLFSWQFLQAVLALAAVLAIVGALFWVFERKRNADEFGGPWWRGIGSGLWFSAVTMTTVGYGDKSPRTPAGRVIALIWMFTAIIIISTFTGLIASALTTNRLSGVVEGPDDLPNVTVGSIEESASDAWLAQEHVNFRGFDSVEAGLKAVDSGGIQAFVYDKPLLQYLVGNGEHDALSVLPGTFGHQDYGIALPQGSDRREATNETLLKYIDSEAWNDLVFKYLGKAE